MEQADIDAALTPEFSGQVDDAPEASIPQEEPETNTEPEGQTTEEADPEEDVDDGSGQGAIGNEEDEDYVIPAKEYKELRKFATQKAMEAAAYKKRLAEKFPEGEPTVAEPVANPKAPNDLERYIAQQIETGVQSLLEPLQQQQEDLRIQSEVQALSEKYKDFSDVAPAFIETLETTPEFFAMENGIEKAYRLARAETIERESEARSIAAAQAARRTTAQKVAATDNTPITKSQSQNASVQAADAIRDSILGAVSRTSIFDK